MPEKTASMSLDVRIKLSAMMFFQYMLVAVWFVQLSAYLENLQMSGTQMAWILSSMALGCIGSPLVGMFADRHFASQHVLAVLNLLTAGLLVGAATVTAPGPVFVMLLLAMLCYMPTWGLTSAIAMSHSPSEKFPQIRVFGSIGWVAAGLFSLVAIHFSGVPIKILGLKIVIDIFDVKEFDGTALPLYCGAAVALVAAVHALLLPHTPPPAKGQKASVVDALGLRSLSLMKDVQFSVLIVGTLIGTIAFASYWSYCSAFLKGEGFKYLTVTMGWGQFVEMFLMLLVPVALSVIGLKWTIVVGLAAMLLRYLGFTLGGAYSMNWLYFGAIFVHGIIFGFFYVGGQIYIDRKAPKEMKAQAQGLIFLVSFGVGLLIGNFVNGALLESGVAEGAVKNYQLMWIVSSIISAAVLVIFVLLFRDPVAALGAEKTLAQPADQPPAEEAPAADEAFAAVAMADATAEEAPAAEPEAPAEEPPAEDAPAEPEPPAEEAPAAEAPPEPEPPAEEPPAEDEPAADEDDDQP